MLINTPHNPTGAVLNRAELVAIADIAARHDLTVITDEVYEHLVFDDNEHIPLATLPGMFDRTVTLSSVGQVVFIHRLEGRLGDRTYRPRRRRARRETVAEFHVRRTLPTGGGGRLGRGARLPEEVGRRSGGTP